MELKVDENLIKIAKIFAKHDARLYIVGGFVRNAILGFCETDIDICSRLLPEEIEKILDKRKFTVKLINPKLGTVHIRAKDDTVEYEHTTFRAEMYKQGGGHSPKEVRFVDDMSQDASRRDFTANAIYYDILSGEIVDYYNGVADVKSKVLRTVETPEFVFSRDGLRILRMVRIANELGFCIDNHTFEVARELSHQLNDISQERFNKEIVAILFADYKYDAIDNVNAYLTGLEQVGNLHAWEYVLPKFTEIAGRERVKELYKNEWQNLIKRAHPALRISAFVIDMCRGLKIDATKQVVFAILGTGGMMLNKQECERQYRLIFAFERVRKGEIFSEETGRMFLQENHFILIELLALLELAHIGANLARTYKLMQVDKVPFNIKQLQINGNVIAQNLPEIKKIYYSKILNTLLNRCAIMPELNKQELLINCAKQIYLELKK